MVGRNPRNMSLLKTLTIVPQARRGISTKNRKIIYDKTGGVCHICGGGLEKRWVVDHVKPLSKGGANSIDNYLPACKSCNRLKWHRSPETIRFILQLGTYARKEIEHYTKIGQRLAKIFSRKEKSNGKRRTKKTKVSPEV